MGQITHVLQKKQGAGSQVIPKSGIQPRRTVTERTAENAVINDNQEADASGTYSDKARSSELS